MVLMATFLLVVFRDLTEGIVVGFGIGALLFLHRMAQAVEVVSGRPVMEKDQADTIGVLGLALNACDDRANGHRDELEGHRTADRAAAHDASASVEGQARFLGLSDRDRPTPARDVGSRR